MAWWKCDSTVTQSMLWSSLRRSRKQCAQYAGVGVYSARDAHANTCACMHRGTQTVRNMMVNIPRRRGVCNSWTPAANTHNTHARTHTSRTHTHQKNLTRTHTHQPTHRIAYTNTYTHTHARTHARTHAHTPRHTNQTHHFPIQTSTGEAVNCSYIYCH